MQHHVHARRGHHPHWLLLAGLALGVVDIALQLTVPQMQRGPAALGSLVAALGCLILVIMDAERTPPQLSAGRISVSLRLAAAAARAGRSPLWIARVFRLPVAFAELLAAEARERPRTLGSTRD
jgi:hypothetical protein